MCLMPQQTADSPASRRASPIPRMGVRLLLVVFIVKGTATSRWKVAELWPVFKKTRHKLKQWSKQLGSLLDLFDVRLVVPFSMALRLYFGSLCWYVRRLSVAGDKSELGDVSRQSEQDGHQQLVVVRLFTTLLTLCFPCTWYWDHASDVVLEARVKTSVLALVLRWIMVISVKFASWQLSVVGHGVRFALPDTSW